LAVKTDGTLWAWGFEEGGDIPVLYGSPTRVFAPYQIGTDRNWSAVAAGEKCSFAIKTDGTLWGFGHFKILDSRLRDVTVFNYSVPTQIGTAKNWSKVYANLGHVILLGTDGTLWGFGDNSSGELGINTKDDYKTTPVQIGTDKNWEKVAVGYSHTMAIKTDGTLWAWGKNVYGELGNNAAWSERNPAPIRIGTANNWKSVSAGDGFTAGITSDGVLWTWGKNKYGNLGDGTTVNRKPHQAIAFVSTGRPTVAAQAPARPAVNVQTGAFLDTRDGQVYRTVTIGNVTWLAENLKFKINGSTVNNGMGGAYENLALYGRLYDWETAKKACPPGWRIPTRSDWDALARAVGGTRYTAIDDGSKGELVHWKGAGLQIKSNTRWRTYFGEPGIGPDDFKFSAMPGGIYRDNSGDGYPESDTRWWSAEEFSGRGAYASGWAYSRRLQYNGDDLYENIAPKVTFMLSVRAVRVNAPFMSVIPTAQDRTNFTLTAFSIPKTTISRNEDFEIHFRLKSMASSFRPLNVYAMVEFLDKDGKRAKLFGGADVELPAGGEDALRAIHLSPGRLLDVTPGQYQLRVVIEYFDNHVKAQKLITQTSPGVPTAINLTVSNEPLQVRSGER
jgi:uncharacterized protein (TIGR02145 family)